MAGVTLVSHSRVLAFLCRMCGLLAGGPRVSPQATGFHRLLLQSSLRPVYYHYPHFNLTWSDLGPEGGAENAI